MKNLKNKIKNWLFEKEIVELLKLKKEVDSLKLTKIQYEYLLQQVDSINVDQRQLEKELREITGCGLNVGLKYSPNWAVICIQGKQDFIKFIDLDNKELRDIQHFLRRFDKRNCSIDLPHRIPKDVFFKI